MTAWTLSHVSKGLISLTNLVKFALFHLKSSIVCSPNAINIKSGGIFFSNIYGIKFKSNILLTYSIKYFFDTSRNSYYSFSFIFDSFLFSVCYCWNVWWFLVMRLKLMFAINVDSWLILDGKHQVIFKPPSLQMMLHYVQSAAAYVIMYIWKNIHEM